MGHDLKDPDSVIQLCTDTVRQLVALAALADGKGWGNLSSFLLGSTADHIARFGIQLIIEQQERQGHEHTD